MRLVLFFTWDVSLAEWKRKGLLQRELKLYEALTDEGIEIVLVTWGGAEDLIIAKDFPRFKVFPLYEHIPRHGNKAIRAISSLLAPFVLKRLVTKDTVLKTNQMWGSWVAVLAKYIYRRPLLLRTGFELYDFTVKGQYGFFRRSLIRMISFIGYGAADHVFVATENDRVFVMKNFQVPVAKISICPNWIETDKFSPDDATGRNDRLLFVGRLNAQKNLPALIEAAAAAGYGLDIIGEGELKTDLSRLVTDKKADVRFLGSLPNDSLPFEYRRYGLFVLPSFYEGNPKTLLEAMACGAPVLGADAPGIRELITVGQSGYLCKNDAISLRDAIEHLMRDPALRKAMGNKARLTILANNTLAAQVQREVKSLQTLMSREKCL